MICLSGSYDQSNTASHITFLSFHVKRNSLTYYAFISLNMKVLHLWCSYFIWYQVHINLRDLSAMIHIHTRCTIQLGSINCRKQSQNASQCCATLKNRISKCFFIYMHAWAWFCLRYVAKFALSNDIIMPSCKNTDGPLSRLKWK